MSWISTLSGVARADSVEGRVCSSPGSSFIFGLTELEGSLSLNV